MAGFYSRRRTWRLVAAVVSVTGAIAAPPVIAADVSSQWLGVSGSWNVATNWSNTPAVVQYPNNGNGGFTYDATVSANIATLSGDITLQTLTMVGGAAAQINGTGNLNVDTFNWTGGSLTGTGTLTASTSMVISGSSGHSFSRTIDNAGTATWTGTGGVSGSGTFNNLTGALLQANGTSAAFGIPSVNNAGTIRKNSAGGTSFGGVAVVSNTGTVEVLTGTLNINGAVAQYTPGVLSGGNWLIASTLNFPNANPITTLSGGSVTLDGATSVFTNINGLADVQSGATFTIDNGRNFTSVAGLNNNGTVNVGTGSTLTLPGSSTHTGVFNVASGGVLDLTVVAGTHTFDPGGQIAGAGVINLGSGTLTGSGALSISGTFNFTAGVIAGSGVKTIEPGSTINISGVGGKTISGTLENGGDAYWSGTSGIFGSGTFTNLAGGMLEANGTGSAFGIPTVNNAGTIRKNSAGMTNFGGVATVSNTGTVEVLAGTLNINGTVAQYASNTLSGGTWLVAGTLNFPGASAITTLSGGSVTLDGAASVFNSINGLSDVQAGATFTIDNGRNFTTAAGLTIGGTVNAGTGSTLTLPGGNTHDLTGGTLGGAGAMSISGTFNFTSGTIAGAGVKTIEPGATLNISGVGAKTISGTLENAGSAFWSGTAGIFGSGTFTNLAGATLEANGTGSAFGIPTVNNAGTITKTNLGTTSFGGVATVDNTGTVHVTQGTLRFAGNVVQRSGTTLTGGTWIAENATLAFDGGSNITTISPGASVTLDGSASVFNRINALADNQGSFTVTNGRTFATAGSLKNSGTLTIGPSARLSLTGVMTDSGSLAIDAAGRLDLRDQKLITSDAIGTWNGSAYTDVTALIADGRNGGSWDGAGITTSMPDAIGGSGYTVLGVATASEVKGIAASATDTWAGQTVTGSDTLVMYTYGGDANLSGNVDIDDYTQIDSNASLGGILTGWFNGDFDYNGLSDIDDYTIIDSVIGIQGPAFPTGGGVGLTVAAVPEPSAACLMGLTVLSTLSRRRRR